MKYYKCRTDGTYWAKTIEEIDLERIHKHLENYGLIDKDDILEYGDIVSAIQRKDKSVMYNIIKPVCCTRIARHIRYLLDQLVIHDGKIMNNMHPTTAEKFLVLINGSIIEAEKNPY